MPTTSDRFVGIQVSPISFVDEGVEPLLDLLKERFGINALLIGTISWLGLKAGRRVSWKLDGWPDHGKPEAGDFKGGSYIAEHPEYYANTFIKQFPLARTTRRATSTSWPKSSRRRKSAACASTPN